MCVNYTTMELAHMWTHSKLTHSTVYQSSSMISSVIWSAIIIMLGNLSRGILLIRPNKFTRKV